MLYSKLLPFIEPFWNQYFFWGMPFVLALIVEIYKKYWREGGGN